MIRNQIKEKRKNIHFNSAKEPAVKVNKWHLFVTKIMILIVLFLGVLIYTKSSTSNKQKFYDVLLKESFSFATINNLYNKYLGGILPFKDLVKDNKPVFKEKLSYKESNIYKDGVVLGVEKAYLVPVLESGIVVFIGEKEGYGKTVIVQQTNGIDVWYGNVDSLNVKIYDYIEGGSLLGETIDEKLYLVFKKEGKVIDYKKYI